jgi:hypothetical protein
VHGLFGQEVTPDTQHADAHITLTLTGNIDPKKLSGAHLRGETGQYRVSGALTFIVEAAVLSSAEISGSTEPDSAKNHEFELLPSLPRSSPGNQYFLAFQNSNIIDETVNLMIAIKGPEKTLEALKHAQERARYAFVRLAAAEAVRKISEAMTPALSLLASPTN